jgi:hypothetical protein
MSNIHIINLNEYSSPVIKETLKDEWVSFGEKNNYYQELIDAYNTSTTNNSIIDAICRLIYGKGLDARDGRLKPTEYAQTKMLFKPKFLKKIITDFKMLGQFAIQIIYNEKGDSIVQVEHMPVHLLRAQKCNDEGEITGYWYSDNWQDIKKFPPKFIDGFGYGNGKDLEIYFVGNYTVGQKYYSLVDYVGSLPYAKLEKEIADYLINEVQNSFSPTTIVNFNNGIPDEEKQKLLARKVENTITGSQGKKVVVAFNDSETQKTTVDSISLNDAPAHYEYLSNEARNKILLGHKVVSGLLFGIPSANGFSSNADELKNASILFDNMVIKTFQNVILETLDEILSFNLVFLDLQFKTLQPLEFKDDTAVLPIEQKLSSNIDEIDIDKFGELMNLEEWELVSSDAVNYENESNLDAELQKLNNPKLSLKEQVLNLVSTGRAQPNVTSRQDGVLYVARYRYMGELKENSRPFCQRMIATNKLYRKEDIVKMGESKNSNPGWGPNGVDKYNIFFYKGGGACHHFWQREIYRRIGSFNQNGENKKEFTPSQSRKDGYLAPVNDKLVYTKPINMPNQGFLN